MKKDVKGIVIVVLLFILTILVCLLIPVDTNKYIMDGSLYINEVMSENSYTYRDNYGKYSDYIELYNDSDEDINLEGYYLSDSNNHYKWEFKDVVIKSKDYLLVYASGKNECIDNVCHTNFNLSSDGEIVTLTNKDRKVISQISYNKSKSDIAYGYNGDGYVYYYLGTPLSENNSKYSDKVIKEEDSSNIIINEYMNNNVSTNIDEDNRYGNYVELYNKSNKEIDLSNYKICVDDVTNCYIFKEISIKDYYSFYMDGYDYIKSYVHTSNKLDISSKYLILIDNLDRVIDKIDIISLPVNTTSDKDGKIYINSTFNKENSLEYYTSVNEMNTSNEDIIINEVCASNNGVEIKNISNNEINLSNYKLGDKAGNIINLPNKIIKSGEYYVNYDLGINNYQEIVYLYNISGKLLDEFRTGKMNNNNSYGIDKDGNKKIYVNNTLGYDNGDSNILGYLNNPVMSIQGGYVEEGTEITITSSDNADIYYTLDGSFPTKNSSKYEGSIKISKTTIIKCISIKDNYIDSDYVARTFIVGREHDIGVVSITSDYNNLFGYSGLISNYGSTALKKISFEYYESDGAYGTSFVGEAKLSGNFGGSRDKAQRGISVYLRKEYGFNTISYPLFDDEVKEYSSLLLRNGGEDYLNIHIFDAALQYALKGQMDIDMQDYKPVVVYINGEYYGIYNLRDKLNSDYVGNKYNVSKDEMDVIKYSSATVGDTSSWNSLVSYIRNHDVTNSDVYEYLETQIDMQELVNYWIVQSYYGNTDLGNIKYYKVDGGKWRMMLYDIDWSLYNTSTNYTYPVINSNIPAVTYVYSTIEITRKLYQNSEFRELYLSSLGYHMKNTFNPERMNKIVDELAAEIESEVEYHTNRWSGTNSSLGSVSTWKNNVERLKNKLTNRYNYVKNTIKSSFSLSDSEYQKYFGDME